jgi:hypothetical protein
MKKFKISTIAAISVYAILATGCSANVGEVKPGEMKFIPYTPNYAIGTDSTIVIVDRKSGKTLNVIGRHSGCE